MDQRPRTSPIGHLVNGVLTRRLDELVKGFGDTAVPGGRVAC